MNYQQMNYQQLMALICLTATVSYRVWAFTQSLPLLSHRRMTFWCGLFFTFSSWQWGEQVEFMTALGGFVAGWMYMRIRLSMKAAHLFGKEVSGGLFKEGL
jgi:hypothetical protein